MKNDCGASVMKKKMVKKEGSGGGFLNELEARRVQKVVNSGTVWLKSYDEYLALSEAYEGKIVKPIHAAKMLGVSRAMILQLEREGKLRVYRLTFNDEVWKSIPIHLKPLITRNDVYLWIPIEDIEAYAKSKGRKLKQVKGYYISEFFG